ncbi:IS66 family transposase [Candidatus Woesebacteria bacterium]|nr:IS66 family transposase [Candidatus Woesebacteria bacterium]
MMSAQEELGKLRPELRYLRIHVQQLERVHLMQKNKADTLEEEVRQKDTRIRDLERQKEKLEEELEKTKRERDTYKGMVFKSKRVCSNPEEHKSGKKRGGQKGHQGVSFQKPEKIDRHIHAYLTNCPDCGGKLSQTESVDTHTVVDIPHWKETRSITTEYSIERQWCSNCHKEVRALPENVIPNSRYGFTLFVCVLVWRYRFRDPLNKIVERLQVHYQLKISEGELVLLLKRGKQFLGRKYDDILREIRGSPAKHADETSWRVNGENWWCWAALTDKSIYYTIEDTRGKGVAKEIFEGSKGVLIRDDYAAYNTVSSQQQSCWTHLLRKSHDAAHHENASEEVAKLHKILKDLFDLISEDCRKPFNQKARKELYLWYKKDIEKIINTNYQALDAKKIQTRIRNQNTNLLTALLYEGVSLTNNPAEQAMRAIVITRKISGGSKSKEGAKTHAVNMSIIETINKQKLPLLDTLQEYLLNGAGKR